jgi:hypothetical protein
MFKATLYSLSQWINWMTTRHLDTTAYQLYFTLRKMESSENIDT